MGRGQLTDQKTFMDDDADIGLDRYQQLTVVDGAIARGSLNPRLFVYGFTLLAVVTGWVWIVFLAAGVNGGSVAGLGPGMGFLEGWLEELSISPSQSPLIAMLVRLCTPQFSSGFSLAAFFAGFAMWITMSIAMMLPSAAPMFRTYGDIADVAARKGEKVVPLFVLALGYLAVWAMFAVVASFVQLSLVALGATSDGVSPLHGITGGLILIVAGAYQFSNLRQACLEKCRNPFSILFGRWSTSWRRIFKLGFEQGTYCVGCCWALMLVMFVVGTMNLTWMAFFTLFAILEKSGTGKVTSRASGGILLAWGGILTALSLSGSV